jgi:Tfp pilus tip-associated adhesin PilY1
MIMPKKMIVIIIAAIFMTVYSGVVSRADDSSLWTTTTIPDALIILDRSGSMQDLPLGSNPTMYVCGGSCNISGPFYATGQPTQVPSKLYDITGTGGTCSGGPYFSQKSGSMPTNNMYVVTGSTCSSYNGPFYLSQPSDAFPSTITTVYTNGSSCTSTGAAFYTASGSGHTKSCTVSSSGISGNPIYATSGTNCTTPSTSSAFYKLSSSAGSGYVTCNKYITCTAPTTGYTSGNCTDTGAIFYKSSQSGYMTPCGTDTTCTPPSTMYTDTSSDCAAGPFYTSSVTGYTTACQACNTSCTSYNGSNETNSIVYGDTACAGPFYSSSGTGHTANCSKIEIAKRSIFQLMDNNVTGTVDSTDVTGLGVRLGFMTYYNCSSSNSTTYSYPAGSSSSCIQLAWPLTTSDNVTPTSYANIYCNNTSCLSTVTSCTGSHECVAGETVSGGTPLGNAIAQGTTYLSYQKTLDSSATCRSKSIILITDGADTFSCSGDGSSTNAPQRRSPVYYASAAKALGFSVFVVGFGTNMPQSDQNTLNWSAFYGGTRNPNTTQSGSTTAVPVSSTPCTSGTDPGSYNLSGYAFMASNPADLVSSLQAAITAIQQAEYSFSSEAAIAAARTQDENFIYEATFYPQNSAGADKEPFWPGHLKKYAINSTSGSSYGQIIFPAEWDAGTNLMNTASTSRNMWTLKNGTMTSFDTSNITDADLGTGTSTSTCTTQTGTCGTVTNGCACGAVVGFYRGDSTYNLEQWKLGDLYHTNPVLIKTPPHYFYDPRECTPVSGLSSYASYYASNQRSSAAGNQIILAGANDGQLHAFTTGSGSDPTAGGEEVWSFFPPNLLQKIAPIAHNDHSNRKTLYSHDLFVDGPLNAADVWLPSSAGSGVTKNASDWKTIAIIEEGQGSGNYLWSSSSNCYVPYTTTSTGFSATYDATNYPYYCGLYALNVTNTTSTNPTYLWHLNPSSAQAPYLGQAWSKMQIGPTASRVKISGKEKWVGFIGGGYDGTSCKSADLTTTTACNTVATGSSGKGFYVVDLTNGNILWSFTYGASATSTTSPYMVFDLAGAPAAIDEDSDGFVDTVYIGDLGGNIWRFRLCTNQVCSSGVCTSDITSCGSSSYSTACSTSNWKGSLFFQSTDVERGYALSTPANTHKQIFTKPATSIDTNGNWWIFFGTGEDTDPLSKPTDTSDTKNRLYAVEEDNLALDDQNGTAYPTYKSSNLVDITNSTYTSSTTTHGWYINLSTNTLTRGDGTTITNPVGEKMISDPTINGLAYFMTYVPYQGTVLACGYAGDAFLYELSCSTGAGAVDSSGTRAKWVGQGIGSSILVSYSPGYGVGSIYGSASGGKNGFTTSQYGTVPGNASLTNIHYWKDKRLEQH